jgi:hypothetical protein
MDPTQSNDGPYFGPDTPDDDTLIPSYEADDADDFAVGGPGEGDATIMAWARAM